MRIISPYDTTYGQLINTTRVEKELVQYLATTPNKHLNYEFIEGETRLVFILGAIQEERDLPVWEHPIVFKDLNNRITVATDLRKYVKKIDDFPLNISDVTKDASVTNFLILRTLLTADYAEERIGNLRPIYNNLASSFGLFVSTIVSALVGLTPDEKVKLEIGMGYYLNSMIVEDLKESKSIVRARLEKTKFSLPVGKRFIDSVVDELPDEIESIDDMEEIIKRTIQPEKAMIVNVNAIINAIANVWYGPGGSETVIMSLEHLPTWVALVTANITNRSYKRTRFGSIIDKNNNKIKGKEIEKTMELYFKEKQHGSDY